MDELQVNQNRQQNLEMQTMRYTHLIEGDEPDLTINV
jgi:hypothetical protein